MVTDEQRIIQASRLQLAIKTYWRSNNTNKEAASLIEWLSGWFAFYAY